MVLGGGLQNLMKLTLFPCVCVGGGANQLCYPENLQLAEEKHKHNDNERDILQIVCTKVIICKFSLVRIN